MTRSVRFLSSKRFMRGSYRVLRPLLNVTTSGMSRAFGSKYVVDDLGGNHAAAIRECNHTCLSILACETWQYSRSWGCYVDAQGIGYPGVTPDVFHYGGTFLQSVVAGEYIQRFCGPQPLSLTAAADAKMFRIVTWSPKATSVTSTVVPIFRNGEDWNMIEHSTQAPSFQGVGAAVPSNETGAAKMSFFPYVVVALCAVGLLAIAVVFLPTLYARCRKGSFGRGVDLSRSSRAADTMPSVRQSKRRPMPSGEPTPQVPSVVVPLVGGLTPPVGLSIVPLDTVSVPVATYSRIQTASSASFAPPEPRFDAYAAGTYQPASSFPSFAPLEADSRVAKPPLDPYEVAAERLHSIAAGGRTSLSFDASRATPTPTFTASSETNILLGQLV